MGGVGYAKLAAVRKRGDARRMVGAANGIGVGNRPQQIANQTVQLAIGYQVGGLLVPD